VRTVSLRTLLHKRAPTGTPLEPQAFESWRHYRTNEAGCIVQMVGTGSQGGAPDMRIYLKNL
jgi:hypothetical protein